MLKNKPPDYNTARVRRWYRISRAYKRLAEWGVKIESLKPGQEINIRQITYLCIDPETGSRLELGPLWYAFKQKRRYVVINIPEIQRYHNEHSVSVHTL